MADLPTMHRLKIVQTEPGVYNATVTLDDRPLNYVKAITVAMSADQAYATATIEIHVLPDLDVLAEVEDEVHTP